MGLCERCGNAEITIHLAVEESTVRLCQDCFNKMNSFELGVELEEQPEAIYIPDVQGVMHHFNVIKRILPNGIFLEAKEHVSFGYTFAVHGELDCDQSMLFQKLVDKVKHHLSKQYLQEITFPESEQKQLVMVGDEIQGTFDYDENNEDAPLIIIDGKPYEWDELGKILRSNEGFQFQLKISDLTEDI